MICLSAGLIYAAPVQFGLDRMGEYQNLFRGKRIGLITNRSAMTSSGQNLMEVFMDLPDTQVTALYAPEHGLWGSEAAGADVNTVIHPVYGIPVFSLYRDDGRMAQPTAAMLEPIDVLVFDIQDIGARFYTYIWTMALAMEAAAENQRAFVVLDRPNPLAPLGVQGPVLDRRFASFKGLYPIPVLHAMTVGELARLFNGEGWLAHGVQADLTVIPMTGWFHRMAFPATGHRFIPPSPNMQTLDTALVYPGLALLEGTNVSEGRGTDLAFLQFGAPWLKTEELIRLLNDRPCPGIRFTATTFTPTSSKYAGELCQGVRLQITDPTQLAPFTLGIQIVRTIAGLYPEQLQWRGQHFDELCGTDQIRHAIEEHQPLEQISASWESPLQAFKRVRRRYLLYP